jgi:PAS domain S-box-containing protein
LGRSGGCLEIVDQEADGNAGRERLLAADERLRYLLSSTAAVIYTSRASGDYGATFISKSVTRATGFSPEEFTSDSSFWINHVHSDDRDRILGELPQIFDKGRHVYDYRFLCSNGEYRWFLDEMKLVRDPEGEPLEIIGYWTDVTERKEADGQLKASEQRYRNLVETAPDGIVAMDMKGVVISANRAFLRHTGLAEEDIVGKHVLKMSTMRIRDLPRFARLLSSALKGRLPESIEYIYRTKAGEERWGDAHPSLLRDGKKLTGIQIVTRDITDRKKAAEQLKKYSQHLEELVEDQTSRLRTAERMAAIGETTTMVGHDLRNPLQAIVNNLYLAKRKLGDMSPEELAVVEKSGLEDFRERIEEQVKYMNKIVSDLQDYARPIDPRLRRTDLEELVGDAVSDMVIPGNVDISTDADPDFPRVEVDPDMIKRVLANLITNAVQAMPKGGKLKVSLREDGRTATIGVTDTGTGIAKENLDKLFQPLFTTKSQGQGFGLPVCERLARAHGGAITVQSTEGKGSTFTISIPIAA